MVEAEGPLESNQPIDDMPGITDMSESIQQPNDDMPGITEVTESIQQPIDDMPGITEMSESIQQPNDDMPGITEVTESIQQPTEDMTDNPDVVTKSVDDILGIDEFAETLQSYTLEEIMEINPEAKKEAAEKKLEDLRDFGENVNACLKSIKKSMDVLSKKFQDSAYRRDGDQGFLTGVYDSYRECLCYEQSKLEQLDQLLSQDLQKWQQTLLRSKQLANKIRAQVEVLEEAEEEKRRQEHAKKQNPLRHIHLLPVSKYRT